MARVLIGLGFSCIGRRVYGVGLREVVGFRVGSGLRAYAGFG